MARDPRRAYSTWKTPEGDAFLWEHVSIELLMDIRGELVRLNQLLQCPNFLAIPATLTAIRRQMARPRRKRRTS
jgi:hypothetical protein